MLSCFYDNVSNRRYLKGKKYHVDIFDYLNSILKTIGFILLHNLNVLNK